MNLGIYIHIPFCNSKCYYCDFCSKEGVCEEKVEEYIDALIKEIIINAELLAESKVTSIYIGGGTPSAIDAKHLYRVLQVIYSCTNVTENAEITVEVNPESVNTEKLQVYKAAGINRISMGLQTINDKILKNIGRQTTFVMFDKAYKEVVRSGFSNISLDIMCGLPDDTLEGFIETVNYALSLDNIKHISSYSLEVHENSKLDFLINSGFLTLPSSELERQMKYTLDEMLEAQGFSMYEISNYAKPGYEAKHNLKYWTGVNYLGFGASASSYINSTRYTNVKDIDKYIEGINQNNILRVEIEELDLLDLEKEYVILGLRLTQGINVKDFYSKFKIDIYEIFGEELNKCINNGLLIKNGDNIYLSKRGQDVANLVWQEFI